MNSEAKPLEGIPPDGVGDTSRRSNGVAEKSGGLEEDNDKMLVKVDRTESEGDLTRMTNGCDGMNHASTVKHDDDSNELSNNGLVSDNAARDAQECREMGVVARREDERVSCRSGSPVQHRRNRATRPIRNRRDEEGDIADLGKERDSENQRGLVVRSPMLTSESAPKTPAPFRQNSSPLLPHELSEVDLSIIRDPVPTPLPVTLLGVSTDLRRKRIKKVSNYIIGALLGEGTYGVVRDGLDISGDYISRCAVKMVNISSSSTVAAKGRPALRRTDRSAYLKRVAQRETVNLQRFHSPYVVRAHDIFTLNGKEYIILPIAICSLEQLVQDALHRTASAKPRRADRCDSPREDEAASAASTASYRSGGSGDPSGGCRGPGRGDARLSLLPLCTAPPTAASTPLEASRSVSFSVASDSSGGEGSTVSGSTHACGSFHTEAPREAGNPPSPCLLQPQHSSPKGSLEPPDCEAREPEPILSMMLIKGIMFQILSGVNYLHCQNTAHNDIKISNILLFENGSVKLTDLGSAGEYYDGYGTPLYAAPELCKFFYGLVEGNGGDDGKISGIDDTRFDDGRGSSRSRSRGPRYGGLCEIDAKKCDMWCCGLVLYKLLTGNDGPLRAHQNYSHRRLKDSSNDYDDNSATPASLINCFQLYREIASQGEPVCLDDVPNDVVGTVAAEQAPVDGFVRRYPPNSVRNLLERLLAIDPEERPTAEEALAHPWIASILEFGAAFCGPGQSQNPDVSNKRRSSVQREVEETIRRGIACRVLHSPHVREILKRDNESHLQFVADCCNILDLDIPEEIFKPFGTEPYENNYYGDVWRVIAARAKRSVPASSAPSVADTSVDGVVMGTLVRPNLPEVMPRGCVDPHLFLPFDECNYYERKSGKKGFDVRCLLAQPMKVRQLEAYLHNVVLVKCGYRTGPDPAFEAATRAGLSFLPRLRHHLGAFGHDVGCLSGAVASSSSSPPSSPPPPPPASSGASAAAVQAGGVRGGPYRVPSPETASQRSPLLATAYRTAQGVGEGGGGRQRITASSSSSSSSTTIIPRIPLTTMPAGGSATTPGSWGDNERRAGARQETRQATSIHRSPRGLYQGSEREGIEATAESSKCFCGLV